MSDSLAHTSCFVERRYSSQRRIVDFDGGDTPRATSLTDDENDACLTRSEERRERVEGAVPNDKVTFGRRVRVALDPVKDRRHRLVLFDGQEVAGGLVLTEEEVALVAVRLDAIDLDDPVG